MYSPQYLLKGFETLPTKGRLQVFGKMLGALVQANMVDVRPRPPVSSIKVVSDGSTWQDAARAVELGHVSCPGAVAWRVAELRKAGEKALWVATADGRLLVQRANGTRENPCGNVVWTDGFNALSQSAMWTPTLEMTSFETTPAAKKMTVICKMLDVLHAANLAWLQAGNVAPPLYQSGLRYQEEKLGKDEWQDIPRTLFLRDQGQGSDCEDLASYRVSELRFAGEKANHTVEHRRSPDLVLYHIRVIRQNGDVEDPSCALGMAGTCSNLVPHAKVATQTAGPMFGATAQLTLPQQQVGLVHWMRAGHVKAEDAVLAAF